MMMMVIPAKPYTNFTCGLTTQVETTQVTVDLALIQDAESATLSDVWFPALRFRSSVQIGSNSIFPFPFGQGNDATELQCGHDYVNGLRIRMNGNVMLATRHDLHPTHTRAQHFELVCK